MEKPPDDIATFYRFEIEWDGDPAVPPTRDKLAQALRACANAVAKGGDSGPALFGGWWNAHS
jgi:hypothetical protein